MDHSCVIDVSGAEILGGPDSRSPPIFLPRQPAAASRIVALDIGGSLIKLVYTASCGGGSNGAELRFVNFERRRLDECFEFLQAEGLINCNGGMLSSSTEKCMLKATGGGSHKFADKFQEKLGVFLDKVDELESMVSGANFLLKNIPGAAFTYRNGMKSTVDINPNNLFPYLLVTIGTTVSILKVTGNQKFEVVTGTHISGATMFGLAKLLTGCKSYDEFLQLSQKGDNSVLDSIVKDVCGEVVCQKEGLSMSALAYSFGKVTTSKKKLTDYKPEDLASTLLTAFICNIAQIAFLVASLFGLERVFFGGSFICGHKSTMENISYATEVWSQCQLQAIFLQHEGYLGALGLLVSFGDPTGESRTLDEEVEKESLQDSPAPLDWIPEDGNSDSNVFPYLLVHVGSGVGMIEVSGKGKFKRIMGSHLGGGAILGLARLLTGCSSYEDFLELAERGNKLSIDLTVGDIYGEQGYAQCGFPVSTIVATFGKVNSSKLSEYKVEDLAASLLNFFTYNTGQVVYLVAKLSRLNRIFFRGAYVCGHKKTMDEISGSIKNWSKGKFQTTFMCREGFLGMGTFCSYETMGIDGLAGAGHENISEVLLGSPYTGLFPSFPLSHRQESAEIMTLQGKIESLQHDNAVLKVEVEQLQLHNENVGSKAKLVDNVAKGELERLQKENAELKAKLVGSGEAATM